MYNVQKIGYLLTTKLECSWTRTQSNISKYEIEVVGAVIKIKLRDYFWLFLLLILTQK